MNVLTRGRNKRLVGFVILVAILLSSLLTSVYAETTNKKIFIGEEELSGIYPIESDGLVLLPLRAVSEAIGFNVVWDKETKSANLEKDKTIFIVKAGTDQIILTSKEKQGSAIPTSAKASMVNGVMYVPVDMMDIIVGKESKLTKNEITLDIDREQVRLEDDFFEYINGEWLAEAVIPKDSASIGGFEDLNNETTKRLKDDFDKKLKNRDPKDSKEMQSFLDFYEGILDYEKRDKEAFKPVEKQLKRVEDLKNLEDLSSKLKEFTIIGLPLPIEVVSEMGMEDPSRKELYFEMPSIFLMEKDYYQDGNPTGKILNEAYEKTFNESLVMLGKTGEEAKKITENAMEFDRILSEYSLTTEEEGDTLATYNPEETRDFIKRSKALDLDAYLKSLIKKVPDRVIVSHKAYYDNFDKVVNEKNFEKIKDWMYIKTLLSASPYLSEEFGVVASQAGMILNGMEELPERDEMSYDLASGAFTDVVGNYYGKKYFGEEAKEDVTKMTKDFIEIYKKRIKNLDWLTEATKKEAIKKLDNMTVNIGYEDKIPDRYGKMIYDKSKSLYENVIDFESAINANEFETFSEPFDRHQWQISGHEVNAIYMSLNNSITFPAGILQEPFYSLEKSSSENYGGIGTIIAHEISHAFDPNGAKFDETGKLKDWWTKEDHEEFDKKTEEMIKLFDGVPFADGKVNGKLTVGENIADAGGISIAYEVGKQSKDFNPKEFFESWAKIWRMKSTRELENSLLKMDEHSPNKVRTNLQLSNFDPFYEVYNIEKTDKMYIDPKARVKVWE